MQVLVVGCGRIGNYLVEELLAKGHQVAVVEKDPGRCEELARQDRSNALRIVYGDGNDPMVLREAGARDADALAAATGEDEDNLVIGLLGKREFGIRRVIGRVNNPRNAWLYSAAFGFDAAVRPAETIVSLIEEQIESPAP
ncbi:MAG TPA: NAD-binding protein [Chloroflexota bacterium]|nr:NAD-binding protein [Chloroflexota bacterium]